MKHLNRKQKTKRLVIFGASLLVGLLLISRLPFPISDLLRPIAVFSQIISPSGLKEDEGRTNILLLGIDKRLGVVGSGVLSDTIIAASLDPRSKEVLLLSLPRDLWVKIDRDKNYFAKVNAAYSLGGVEKTREAVEGVLGIPVHYYGVVDFEGFKKGVDILGGIEVNVERAFDDYLFPIAGMEEALCGMEPPEESEEESLLEKEKKQFKYWCRFEHVHFDAGLQLMDGETALKYARSRHAQGFEGTDFARARRQQKVLLATKDKALSLETLTDFGKVRNLWETLSSSVETNLSVWELEKFYSLTQREGDWEVESYVLGQEGEGVSFFYTPSDSTPYGGAYVLLPKAGDYSEVHAYVQKLLFGE